MSSARLVGHLFATLSLLAWIHKHAQLVFACWQAWTWLSWPAWAVLLTGLFMFMHVGTDCSCLDERTDLNNVVGTIMINQQPCSYMIQHAVREWWNNNIEQPCYNNHELGCCIKSGSYQVCKQPLSICQAGTMCWNTWLDYTVILPSLPVLWQILNMKKVCTCI